MPTRDIHTGLLADGEKLPPERRMAATLGISVGTLRKALAELERNDLLERVQGSGNFIRHPLNVENVYALFRLERLNGPAALSAQFLQLEKIHKTPDLPFTAHLEFSVLYHRQSIRLNSVQGEHHGSSQSYRDHCFIQQELR